MKKLLLTGYEPFLNFKTNPTESAVKELDGQVVGNYKITGKVYPVVFNKIKAHIQNDIKTVEPDIVVNLGLAGGIHTVDLERIAINCIDGKMDNDGFKPNGEVIEENGPDGLFSTLPLKQLEEVLKESEVPVRISNSAGTYLCNNVMYSALHFIKENKLDIPAGFIHVPANHEIGLSSSIPSWSQDDITKAVKIIIETL